MHAKSAQPGETKVISLTEELRKEIKRAFEEVYKQWVANRRSAGSVAALAEYTRSGEPILSLLSETNLPGEIKTAWQELAPDERLDALKLWCLEYIFGTMRDKGDRAHG